MKSAAENRVIEKEQHDRATAAEGNARVSGSCGDDLRRTAHEAEQFRRIDVARHAGENSDGEDNGNRQQENRAIEAAGGEVLMRAANRFADGTPERPRRSHRRRSSGGKLLSLHRNLHSLRWRAKKSALTLR